MEPFKTNKFYQNKKSAEIWKVSDKLLLHHFQGNKVQFKIEMPLKLLFVMLKIIFKQTAPSASLNPKRGKVNQLFSFYLSCLCSVHSENVVINSSSTLDIVMLMFHVWTSKRFSTNLIIIYAFKNWMLFVFQKHT